MQTRSAVQAAIRGLAMLLLFVAAGITMWRIIDVLVNWPYVQGHRSARAVLYAIEVRVKETFPAALALCIIAIALWLLQWPLVRLIVPVAGRTCPECGYSLRKLKGTRCPECGTEVAHNGKVANDC